MPEQTAPKSPITALVQSFGNESEIVSGLEARGWHTTLVNDTGKITALIESSHFSVLVFLDSTAVDLDLTSLGREFRTLCVAIVSNSDDLHIEHFDYSFHWSSDGDRNNKNLEHCEVLVALNAELARANSRSRLFIEVGHQLKSPVAVMKEFTHLLQAGVGGTLTQKQTQFVQVIDDNIERLLRLLENVEALGSLDFNGWTVNLEELDCRQIIDKVAASWETMVASKGLVLRVTYPPDHLAVMADSSAIEQILFNLIDNTTKCCLAQVSIILDSKATDATVIFGVTNDGPANPSVLQESIFEPFHRLPDHAAAPGLGLGLTIARKLASAMQAELRLDKNFTGGTRFLLSIPHH